MRIKKYISLLMLMGYLFAVGAPAVFALSCECVAMNTGSTHVCCHHCDHNDASASGQYVLKAPCCGDHHSTEVELYTGSSHDAERYAKRIFVTELPSALAAESVSFIAYIPVVCGVVADPAPSSVEDFRVSSCGLRAPPVLV